VTLLDAARPRIASFVQTKAPILDFVSLAQRRRPLGLSHARFGCLSLSVLAVRRLQMGQQAGAGQKGAATQGQQAGGQQSSEAQDGQAGDDAENGQNAEGKGSGKSSEQQASKAPGSGIGSQDGSKDVKLAEQLAAMGKISEIIGKRSANVTGLPATDTYIEIDSFSSSSRLQCRKVAFDPMAARTTACPAAVISSARQ